MKLPPAIAAEIERYGSTLTVGPDTERPWAVAFRATLQPRSGPALIGIGNSPDGALAELGVAVVHHVHQSLISHD